MALSTYHHGITATESSNVTPILKSVSMSTIALVSTSADANDEAYPLDTPVLLTGITTQDVTNAGSKDSVLYQSLRAIKAIQNTGVVVLRLSEPVDVDTVDLLLGSQTRLGVTPKILVAPEIDTPAMTRKLVEIAKKRGGFVYASPRNDAGELLTDKTEITAYRKTFGARELMIIEGGFGTLGKSDGSSNGSVYPNDFDWESLPLNQIVVINDNDGGGFFEMYLDGVVYNKGAPTQLFGFPSDVFVDAASNGTAFSLTKEGTVNVKLIPKNEQETRSWMFLLGDGVVREDGVFFFRLVGSGDEA